GNLEVDAALADVELDRVAVLDQRQRAAGGGFGRGVQHDRPVRGARHPRVRYANHVGDTLFQQFRRQREIADFGESRVAFGPAVLQHQDVGFVHVELRVVDAPVQIVDVFEHD